MQSSYKPRPYQQRQKPPQSTIMPREKFRRMQAYAMIFLSIPLLFAGVILAVMEVMLGWVLIVVGLFFAGRSMQIFWPGYPRQVWRYIPVEQLRRHDPHYVEQYVAEVFERLGMDNVRVTEQMSDGGIDVLMEMGFVRIGVQVKRYAQQHYVQVDEVRAVLGSREQLGLDKVVFVTTSSFTRYTWETIQKQNIYLVDGRMLEQLGQAAQKQKRPQDVLPGWERFLKNGGR